MIRKVHLKLIRVGVAFPLFLIFLLAFLGEEDISRIVAGTVTWFQFIPSLLHFMSTPNTLMGLGCVAILVLTFVFGRLYCSFLCPLGIFQDVNRRIATKVGLMQRYVYRKPHYVIRYVIPVITLLSLFTGTLTVIDLLDPYSIFGRTAAHLFKTAMVVVNNLLVSILEMFDIYLISYKKQHYIPLSICLITGVSLIIIGVLSLRHGRLYCNTICPVGILLGIISQYSLFTINIDSKKCNKCRACRNICKAGCINSDEAIIDIQRCVSCFNCLTICQASAIQYERPKRALDAADHDQSKRKFMFGSVAIVMFASPILSLFQISIRGASGAQNSFITAPGSFGVDHFTRNCTACHLCVSVCPTHTLVPHFRHGKRIGIMQPIMDYQHGHCDFSCNACGSICPTGAITPLSLGVKKKVQIGTVTLNKKLCIVHVKRIHCGACGEACPTNAIFPAEKGLVLFPTINQEYCIGCGACEHACPTTPKSIFVTGKTVHGEARTYVPDHLPILKINKSDEFPF